MANASSTGPLAGSGAYPKTAEELNKLIEETVDKAVEKEVKSLGVAAHSRPQEAAQRPASKAIVVLTGIIAFAAVATLQLGLFYWLDNSIRSEISGVNGEISSLRAEFSAEISDLRSDMREDFRLLEAKFEAKFDEVWSELGELRSEISALSERMARIEVVVQDRPPQAP